MFEQQEGFFAPANLIIDSEYPDKGKLYLGGIKGAQPYNIHKIQVRAVLTVANDAILKYPPEVTQQTIYIEDEENANIIEHFESGINFINEQLKQNNVLVHCFAGVSRSVTLTCAYLMKTNSWTFDQALEYVKTRRPIAWPNNGFRKQLLNYEKQILKN
ncbi:hypothetical protein pb186bvf_003333 [Paramecium bursaria]